MGMGSGIQLGVFILQDGNRVVGEALVVDLQTHQKQFVLLINLLIIVELALALINQRLEGIYGDFG